jgi:hypothetical protein
MIPILGMWLACGVAVGVVKLIVVVVKLKP